MKKRVPLLILLLFAVLSLKPALSQTDSLVADSLLDVRSIKELRSTMKYPFALDFALQEHLRNKPESLSGCDTVACDDPRALEAFDCYLEAFSKDSDTTRREIGKIKYVDLNNDGYLDILFESIEDILDPNVRVDIFDRNERDSAKSIGDKSKRAERYIWNKKSLIFEKSP